MNLSREPTENERRYMLALARTRHPGARTGGIILVLIALSVAALLVTVAVLDKEVPLQLVVAAAVSGLLGARLLVLSRPPRGHLRVFTHDGAYRSETSSEAESGETVHRIGELRVDPPFHWSSRLRQGRTYHAELGLFAPSLEGDPGAEPTVAIPEKPSAALLSLDGRVRIDREVELGLLRVGFPVSLLAAFFTLIATVVAAVALVMEEEGESVLGRLVSVLRRAIGLRDQPPGVATAAVALALLTALLGLRVAWVIRRNHAILSRIRAESPDPP